jgi:hypothetical protein
MHRFAAATAALLLTVTAFAASWETPSFRTAKGELVRVGMTSAEVVKNAGEPADKKVISHGLTTDEGVGLTHEAWTYRLADGTYTLTFAGTKLEKIEVTPAR